MIEMEEVKERKEMSLTAAFNKEFNKNANNSLVRVC